MGILKACSILCLSVALTLVCACAPHSESPLAYQSRSFSCKLSWEWEETVFQADLTVIVPQEDESHRLCMHFFQPPALQGICVTREGDECFATRQGQLLPATDLSLWLWAAERLLGEGNANALTEKQHEGRKVLAVPLYREGELATVLLDVETHTPCALVWDRITVRISDFAYT